MEETIKFDKTELDEIKNLQNGYANITLELGQVTVQELLLTQRKEFLKQKYGEVQKLNDKIIKKLTEKYGDGSLNLETGEFTRKVEVEE